jgi:hypothetical protein
VLIPYLAVVAAANIRAVEIAAAIIITAARPTEIEAVLELTIVIVLLGFLYLLV